MMKKVLIAVAVLMVAASGLYFCMPAIHFSTPSEIAVGNQESHKKEKVSAVIVPHFDLFKDKRREILEGVAKKTTPPKTIILVSVNHFNAGASNILTTHREWQVEKGEIPADQELVKKIVDSQIAEDDESAFANEHGIKNILADVQQVFPKSKILPLIIKDQTAKATIDKLSAWISTNCKDCLLVSSVDFSHYCPNALANVHDDYTIQALANLDKDKVWEAETDSPQTLYLTLDLAKKNANNFRLFFHANSSDVGGNDGEVTSVVMGDYSNTALETTIELATSFIMAGDAMFDRDVWNNFKDKGQKAIFDRFGTRPFRGTDLSLLNLEGPIGATPITGTRSDEIMSFNFSSEIPSVLNYLNINTVSLANNHTNNAGTTGFANTKKVLDQANIKHVGQPEGAGDGSVLRVDGPVPLSIIGIMALSGFDEQLLEAKIKTEKAAGRFVLIFPHWGEEYKNSHVDSQENLAKTWIAAGADMIVGSHPHVTEDTGFIQGKPVVYSLGNFVFDQFFSRPTQEGLIIAGTITKDKITLSFLPTKEKSIYPEFMAGQEKIDKIKSIINIDAQIGFKKVSYDTIEIAR